MEIIFRLSLWTILVVSTYSMPVQSNNSESENTTIAERLHNLYDGIRLMRKLPTEIEHLIQGDSEVINYMVIAII